MPTTAGKEAAKAVKGAGKEAAKAVGAPANFVVFYRELLPDGTRAGAVASRRFDSRDQADEFAAKVDGSVK